MNANEKRDEKGSLEFTAGPKREPKDSLKKVVHRDIQKSFDLLINIGLTFSLPALSLECNLRSAARGLRSLGHGSGHDVGMGNGMVWYDLYDRPLGPDGCRSGLSH